MTIDDPIDNPFSILKDFEKWYAITYFNVVGKPLNPRCTTLAMLIVMNERNLSCEIPSWLES